MPHTDLTHPELLVKSEEIRRVLTPEMYAHIISLFPTPDKYAVMHNRLEASLTGFLKGDPDMVKECEEARVEINQAITLINGFSKAVSTVDPSVAAAFKATKPATTSTPSVMATATDFKILFDKSGKPYCSFTKFAGAGGYEVWFCVGEPSLEENWQFLTWSTNCQGIYLTGLDRNKTNYLKLRGKRGNSTFGPWSNLAILQPV